MAALPKSDRTVYHRSESPLSAPIAEQLSGDTNGPKPPSSDHPECCGAALHCGHSRMAQHFRWLKRRSADKVCFSVASQ